MTEPLSRDAVVRFVEDEARLLASGDYERWLALFDADGRYWVPLGGERQRDPDSHASLAYEDRLLLAARVERLRRPNAHSLEQGVRGLHVLQAPQVEFGEGDAECRVRTPFVYTEVNGARHLGLVGVWRHWLRMGPGGLKIRLKRVDLLNAGAAHEAIQLFP